MTRSGAIGATGSTLARYRRGLCSVGVTPGVLGLCLLWLVAFAPIVQPLFHAGAPRMALTDAIVTESAAVDRVDENLTTWWVT
ncbi:MAG: hypothetical protein M3471_05880, partial [Actinomycetota bacterium]|nr:hypothetical protein [Actinomycetota bacterium]